MNYMRRETDTLRQEKRELEQSIARLRERRREGRRERKEGGEDSVRARDVTRL